MKLLDEFREAIGALGQIKRAWFTSFNLNPSFVERYILPALAGIETIPVTARDFEIVMHTLHRERMDLRFFCDGRMLELDEGKKTSVTIHPLSISRFDGKFHQGIFHPKVILLQNESGRSMLFVGSANLTVGGWAHNRECLSIKEIQGKQNANAVMLFFRNIFAAIYGEEFPDDFTISTDKEKDDWTFSSPISDGEAFWDRLYYDAPKQLVIWTPFFPSDAKAFANENFKGREVYIIPDIVGNKIRLAQNQENESAKTLENLNFKWFRYDKSDRSDEERMTHAKIWLTDHQVAIGSWNMTGPATGCGQGGDNNIEAGIFQPVKKDELNSVLERCTGLDFELMEESEIEADIPALKQNVFMYNIRVLLDWRNRRYSIRFDNTAEGETLDLQLPDQRIENLRSGDFAVNEEGVEDLLKNHLYILKKNGEPIQTGFITETNQMLRPVWKHGSLSELFNAYISGLPIDDPQHHRLGYRGREYEMADQEDEAAVVPVIQGSISFFGMFQAFTIIRQNLDTAMEQFEQNPDGLAALIRAAPGSLMEIIEKVESACNGKKSEKIFSLVFQWYLVQECNSIIDKLQEFSKQKGKASDLADLIQCLEKKKLNVPVLNLPERHHAYLEAVRQRCRYLG